jgi:hypothetical protein
VKTVAQSEIGPDLGRLSVRLPDRCPEAESSCISPNNTRCLAHAQSVRVSKLEMRFSEIKDVELQ